MKYLAILSLVLSSLFIGSVTASAHSGGTEFQRMP